MLKQKEESGKLLLSSLLFLEDYILFSQGKL